MNEYDPLQPPDPSEWLEMEEDDRLCEVLDYHERTKAPGNLDLHASFHVIVENQCAEDVPYVARALERLQREGLDRHQALHAIITVLMDEIILAERNGGFDEKEYEARLNKLTAEQWLNSEIVDDDEDD